MSRKVIHGKNFAIRPPIIATLVWWLVLERLDASGWIYGVMGTILVVAWIVFFIDISTTDQVDVFKDTK